MITLRSRAIIAAAGFAVLSCSASETTVDPPRLIAPPTQTLGSRQTRVCTQQLAQPRSGAVQLLIDSSGSMNGFARYMPVLSQALGQTISALQSNFIVATEQRRCFFSSRDDFANCSSPEEALMTFAAAGNTTLDEAFARAARAELTLIVTDGVAAASGGGSARCANGVDAACVARAMHGYVVDTAGGGASDRGLWLLPLIVPYDGTYYTERLAAASTFDSAATVEAMQVDVKVPIALQRPETARDGTLTFTYRGPRVLLIFVLAESSAVGRAAVSRLTSSFAHSGFSAVATWQEYDGRIAFLTPMEVFPGYVAPVTWVKRRELDTADSAGRSLDMNANAPVNRIELSCTGGYASLPVQLIGASVADAGECVTLASLPSAEIGLMPAEKARSDEFLALFEKVDVAIGADTRLSMTVACGGSVASPCATPFVAELNSRTLFQASAREIGEGSLGVAILGEVSTSDPVMHPHRAYNPAEIVRQLYLLLPDAERQQPLASVTFCHNSGQP